MGLPDSQPKNDILVTFCLPAQGANKSGKAGESGFLASKTGEVLEEGEENEDY